MHVAAMSDDLHFLHLFRLPLARATLHPVLPPSFGRSKHSAPRIRQTG